MLRIDTHQHLIPPTYRDAMRRAGLGHFAGRALPDWTPEAALAAMAELNVSTAILSVSAPGTTFLTNVADATALARDINDYTAELAKNQPDRFGFFATVPMPHAKQAAHEAVRALDELRADGIILLANSAGTYLGQTGQGDLFAALDARSAVVFVHPGELPGPTVTGIAPFVADFLLDTTRAGYLLVRNGVTRRYPNIHFILAHAGGFLPYASHRLALGLMGEVGRSPADTLDEFTSFYFDTALSSSAAALPSLLAFARPGHVLFGSDWPFAPSVAGQLFAAGLDTYPAIDDSELECINRSNALTLFPRLGAATVPIPTRRTTALGHSIIRRTMRTVVGLMGTT
ncbi:amidohydrolase family protein [Mycobacterium sp. BMJ-28]